MIPFVTAEDGGDMRGDGVPSGPGTGRRGRAGSLVMTQRVPHCRLGTGRRMATGTFSRLRRADIGADLGPARAGFRDRTSASTASVWGHRGCHGIRVVR